MVERFGLISGMKDCLTYAISVVVLTMVTGTVTFGFKAKALSNKKSSNLAHGFEQSSRDLQGRMLFECQGFIRVGRRTFQLGDVGRSNPG